MVLYICSFKVQSFPQVLCTRLYNTEARELWLNLLLSIYKALNQVQSWSNHLTPVGKEGVRIRFRCKHSLSKVSCNLLLFALLRWARRQARPTHIHTTGLHTIFEKGRSFFDFCQPNDEISVRKWQVTTTPKKKICHSFQSHNRCGVMFIPSAS